MSDIETAPAPEAPAAEDKSYFSASTRADLSQPAAPLQVADKGDVREFSSPASDNSMLAMLKAADIPQDIVQGALQYIEHGSDHTPAQLAIHDAQARVSAETELKSLWGAQYEAKVKSIKTYLDTLPAQAREVIMSARDRETGSAYLNDPAVLMRLAGMAGKPRAAVGESDIASIEKFMRSNRAAYNRDEAMQARYRSLLAAK